MPPPSSWQPLCEAGALGPGQTRAVSQGDLELVVWRDVAGSPCVMDARCPHMWSHLAAEGVVDGDELVCGAHFWRFDRDGSGTKLAFSGRRDEKASIRSYPVREEDGHIWADLPRMLGG